jgi:hypothetical protein
MLNRKATAPPATMADIVSHLEWYIETGRKDCAIAEKLASTHPEVAGHLRGQGEHRQAIGEEMLRRLPRMKPALLLELANHIQNERKLRERMRTLTRRDFVQEYLQELWRDPELMKAAAKDGVNLHELPALFIEAGDANR